MELEKQYRAHLALVDVNHSDAVFHDFLIEFGSEVCPVGGVVGYVVGVVECSVHGEEEDSGDDGGVPYL